MKNLYYSLLIFFLCISIILFLDGCNESAETPAPVITSIDPQSGPAGTLVTITGTNFSQTQASNKVKFNGVEATVTSASPTALVVEVPVAAGTGDVTVEVAGKTATGPVFTYMEAVPSQAYYIRYKANGVWKLFESNNPGYQSCGNCACNTISPLSLSDYGSLSVCQDDNNWIVAADILGWDKKQMPFNTSNVFPNANFGFVDGNVPYYSGYATNQTGSTLTISKVEADGDFFGKLAFKVTGTFQCKVAKGDGSSVITITEGSFVVRYSED